VIAEKLWGAGHWLLTTRGGARWEGARTARGAGALIKAIENNCDDDNVGVLLSCGYRILAVGVSCGPCILCLGSRWLLCCAPTHSTHAPTHSAHTMAHLLVAAAACLLLQLLLAACPAAALADDPYYVAPRAVDVVLSDVTELTLKGRISESLNVAYLSRANVSSAWPVHGVLFGPRSRPVVSLPVHSARHASAPVVNVFFIVDTGAWSPVCASAKRHAPRGR
jgi:hypothetical protein